MEDKRERVASPAISPTLQCRGSAALWPQGVHSEGKGMSQRPSRCRLVAISQGPHGEHVRAKEQSLEKWTVPPNTFTENDPKVTNHPFSCCLHYLPVSINTVHVFSTDFILLHTPFLLLFPFPILFCIHTSYTHSPRNIYFKPFITQLYHSKALLKKQSVFTRTCLYAVCAQCVCWCMPTVCMLW